jgi:hypothetical protein
MLTLALITFLVGTALILPGLLGANDAFFPIVVSKKNFAPAEKTGQTASYATGDDGDLQKGVAWPNPRFTDNENGTVTDNLTGLLWLKNANCFGERAWASALTYCNTLAAGSCGLTDSSSAGDWRLPNVRELHTLTDYSSWNPALPNGNPFSSVQSSYYWSSTAQFSNPDGRWGVDFNIGGLSPLSRIDTSDVYVWCVRGGP